ncbi:MAG TPA: hypothetical protein VFG68_01560 [Fimbriiglobus sp.]|nr:hypothetical protein [Fimbriiglobus sp.]
MTKVPAGILGFVVGGGIAVALLKIATEFQLQYRVSQEPPTGEDFQYLGPTIERVFTRLIGAPLAILFGGAGGCWFAV